MGRPRHRTTHERSAGAVIYHGSPDAPHILLLRYGSGHWGFPKGHVERGETDLQAAQREVMEETSISPDCQHVIEGFHDHTHYEFQRGKTTVRKHVEFFLMHSTTRHVHISHEHTGYEWVPYEEALNRVTFDGPRRILKAARAYLDQQAQDSPPERAGPR